MTSIFENEPERNGMRVSLGPITPGQLAQMAIWIVTIVLAYGALSERISVLETKYESLNAQLVSISQKLDRLLERTK